MTIVELTIVMVISAIVLFVAIHGVDIVQHLTMTQTKRMIDSNALYSDYLLLETAIASSDSIIYSEGLAIIIFDNKQLYISNRDSVAIFDRDTLFKTSHRITYHSASGSDSLAISVTSLNTTTELSFLLPQQIQYTRNNEIERSETGYNYLEND